MRKAQQYNKARKGRPARASVSSQVNRYTGTNMRRGLMTAVLRGRNTPMEMRSVDTIIYNDQQTGGTNYVGPLSLKKAGSIQILCQMPVEGPGVWNRISRRTRGHSLEIKGYIKPSLANATAQPAQYARVIVVYDRQANGAVPTLATVLAQYGYDGTAYTDCYAGLNVDQRDRFKILRDRKILLPPLGVNGVAATTSSAAAFSSNGDLSDSLLNFHEYILLGDAETQYKATSSGGVTDISTGAYHIITFASDDASATSAWIFTFSTRYRFRD